MTYTTKSGRKSAVPFALLFGLVLLAVIIVMAVSLNKIRNGQPGFLSNVWQPDPARQAPDPVLQDSPLGLEVPPYVKTILFMGSDFRAELGSLRTDVLTLAAFNTRNGKINLVSFPRDLWVKVPGSYENRINVPYQIGGWGMLSDTFAANFGFRPDHYALLGFDGFENLIIELGNQIEVKVGQPVADECDLSLDPSGWCSVEPGTVTMDSKMALWYVRTRKTSSDFERNKRAQEVIQAIADNALSPSSLKRMPAFLKAIEDNVETDMRLSDMVLYAFPLKKLLHDDLFTTYRITPEMAVGFTTDQGAQVLQPNIPAIQALLNEVFWVSE